MSKKPNNNNSNDKRKDNGRGNNKPSRRNNRGNKPKGDDITSDKKDGDVNDSSYYYIDNTLRDQLMNYSFNSFNGVIEDKDISIPGGATGVHALFSNADVMAIYLNPSVTPPVNPNAPTDGINLVALRNYTLLSANNAKTTNYAPQDVTVLMLALKALAETICWATRCFGFLYLYNQRNRELPDKLLLMNHVDADDFRKNAANYRIRFNTMITAVNKIPFFENYGAFAKAREIYSNVYMDDNSPMAQVYFFAPYSTWLFDEAYDSNGAGLRTWMRYSFGQTFLFSQILDDIQTMIDALLTSTSLNYIYSDVLRVAEKGNGKLMSFGLVPDFYAIDFKMSKEIEAYINNMAYCFQPSESAPGAGDENDLSCDANANLIKYNPTWKSNGGAAYQYYYGLYQHGYVNFDVSNPAIEDRVNATRLACRWKYTMTSASDIESVRVAIGDYYPVYVAMSYEENASPMNMIASTHTVVEAANTVANAKQFFKVVSKLDKFKYGPRLYITDQSAADALICVTGDLNYYTDIDFDLLRSMFDAEMLGEFSLRL